MAIEQEAQMNENSPVGLRSGMDAARHNRVPEYAALTKAKLLALGQTETQAEKARLGILKRWA